MQTACLYIRVSTDEQAIKGYSQRSQLERLLKFCVFRDIIVINTIFEDHSAKTFDRPAWSSMISSIKQHKSLRPNLLLFTKWDRFSRNAGDAYYTITQLRNLGIQPQAIDQELDLSIPENKIILAVYLATSEAENDRRSLNVKQGIHKAKQEGRWTAHVPMGYKHKLMENGQKGICPKEPEATYIRKAYNLVSENQQTIQSVYEQIIISGLKCSISNFCRILRNPVYCGKVLVTAFENEKAHFVIGLHEPLINESLFELVQNIFNKRKQASSVTNKNNDQLFLRGFFHCPSCNKKLTGSASKGKGGYYYYYHCISTCGFRIRADKTNELFLRKIEELSIDNAYLDPYRDILKHIKKDLFIQQSASRNTISQDIDRLIQRIVKAKELLLQGEIETEDYQVIKDDCKKRIDLLGIELHESATLEIKKSERINKVIQELTQLGKVLRAVDISEKRKIIRLTLAGCPILNDELKLSEIISQSLHPLFNIKDVSGIKHAKNLSSYKEWGESYEDKIAEKIMEIEKKKENNIPKKTALEITRFLANYAKLTT